MRGDGCTAGYYSRTAAIKQLVHQFLQSGGSSLEKQILSLGAGFDTTWFHLKVNRPTPYAERRSFLFLFLFYSISRSAYLIPDTVNPCGAMHRFLYA